MTKTFTTLPGIRGTPTAGWSRDIERGYIVYRLWKPGRVVKEVFAPGTGRKVIAARLRVIRTMWRLL